MMRPYLSSTVVLVVAAVSVACGSTIDVGRNEGDAGGGSDATTGVGDRDGGSTAKDGATTSSSKTKSGVSCESADLPPAASACSIPGTYVVTESLCSSTNSTCMDPGATTDFVWTATVTLSGTTVTLTNGSNRLLHCELTPPCTCVGRGGDVFHFTATGFASLGMSSCAGTATQSELDVGVKQ